MRKMYLREVWREFLQPRFAGWFVVSFGIMGLMTFWFAFGELSLLYAGITVTGVLILSQNYSFWERSETREKLHRQLKKAPRAEEAHHRIASYTKGFSPKSYAAICLLSAALGIGLSVLAFSQGDAYLYILLLIAAVTGGYAYQHRKFWLVVLSSIVSLIVLQQATNLTISGEGMMNIRVMTSLFAISMTGLLARQKQTKDDRRPIRIALVLFLLAYAEAWLTALGSFISMLLVGGLSYATFTAIAALYAWFRDGRFSFAKDLGLLSGLSLLGTFTILGEREFVGIILILFATGLLLAGIGLPSRTSRQLASVSLIAASVYYLWLLDTLPMTVDNFIFLQPLSFLGDPLVLILAGGWWLLRDFDSDRIVTALNPAIITAAAAVFIGRWSAALTGISQLSVFAVATAIIILLATWTRIRELRIIAAGYAAIVIANIFVLLPAFSTVERVQLFLLLASEVLLLAITTSSIILKRRYAH